MLRRRGYVHVGALSICLDHRVSPPVCAPQTSGAMRHPPLCQPRALKHGRTGPSVARFDLPLLPYYNQRRSPVSVGQGARRLKEYRGMSGSAEGKPLTLDVATQRAEKLVRKYATNSPYALVADEVVLRNLIRGLAHNWVAHGLPYCPCKEVTGDRERDRRIVCPCKDHRDEIERDGCCCCGLYLNGG